MMKRMLDVLGAILGLIILSPLISLIGVLIRIVDGSPVLYRQVRVGQNGTQFVLAKFRSMRQASGASITAAGDDRITRIGRFIRKYKLDELPQLWNVLVGEMSLVGPRPELPKFVDLEDARWRELLRVKPGITDPASIVFRSEEELLARKSNPEKYYQERLLPEKLSLSLRYLAQRSILLDLRVIVVTAITSAAPMAMNTSRLRQLLLPRSSQ